MPPAVPSTIFPVEERFVNVIRETTPGTIPAGTGTTFPVEKFEPEDKPMWLPDNSLRGSMSEGYYDLLQGPVIADTSVGGPVYVDMIGHPLYSILGDYTQSAPTTTPATTLTAPAAPGATTLTVASGTSFTVGMQILVGAVGSQEIVTVLSGASTTITLNTATPIRIAHASSATVTNTTVAAGTYQHIFTQLNSTFIANGNFQNFGQPPTHTWTDRTQVPATGLARQYAFACFSALNLIGNAEKLLMWDGAFTSFIGQIPGSAPTASVSSVRAFPDFNTTAQIATSGALAAVFNISEYTVGLKRKVEPFFDNDGTQNPYTIGRGGFSTEGKLVFAPATDETALLYMLNNTQPQLQLLTTNGLLTTNPLYQAVQIDIPLAAYDTSKISASRSLFGYDVGFKAIETATTRNSVVPVGWSGGYSPVKVTVSNAVPIF
jgi:hypothetical protein